MELRSSAGKDVKLEDSCEGLSPSLEMVCLGFLTVRAENVDAGGLFARRLGWLLLVCENYVACTCSGLTIAGGFCSMRSKVVVRGNSDDRACFIAG